jgi:acetylornithine deacetylase/succinyl-diaminopimelate desuccinylase-like protein
MEQLMIHITHRRFLGLLILSVVAVNVVPAAGQRPNVNMDWPQVERETLEHFQALVRLDTANPPGNETRAVDYLQGVLEKEGIPVQRFALEAGRANLVARIKGNGSKRPLLLMGHTDVVTVEPARWTFPPFSATRDSGYVYGRGTVDDKDNLAASLMMLLLLKRMNVPLDRDVIFLAESGEEGTTRVGIEFMVNEHFNEIAAEYCIAEGGGVRRENGKAVFASIGTLEKVPRAVELTARGPAGHASVPLQTNPLVHLAKAIAALAEWDTPVRLNETTREYFRRLADISSPEMAQRFRDVLSNDPTVVQSAVDYFETAAPSYAALLRAGVSPTIIQGGNRVNIIPSEAKATVDIRVLPDEEVSELLDAVRRVINDPAVSVDYAARDGSVRPPGGTSINTEAFRVIEAAVRKNYEVVTIPSMGTGATDSAFLRAKGIQCYGIGPATDSEDGTKGFGAHSDQERILEAELYRFVRFYWDVVTGIAQAN